MIRIRFYYYHISNVHVELSDELDSSFKKRVFLIFSPSTTVFKICLHARGFVSSVIDRSKL